MAIIDINSKNKQLSWVIFKNILTQEQEGKPFMRTLRKGSLYGWYTQAQSFRMWFKEGKQESSFYKNLDNNYLNQSAYNCPFAYCSMMAEMLSSTIKQQAEKDIETANSIKLSAVLITLPAIADFFQYFFSSKVKIEMKCLGNKSYEIEFSGNVSLYYLTNLVQVFCLIQAIEDKNIYIDLTPSALTKYAKNLIAIDAPYFIVYLFLSRCVPDFDSFKIVKPMFEKNGVVLCYGNTQKQRYDAIKKFVQGGKVLQDIGCGELYYTRNLSPMYEKIYAWDTDEVIQERNKVFLERKGILNTYLMPSFNEQAIANVNSGDDILITEMIEHMPQKEAEKLLTSLSSCPFRRLIITVPNKKFNQFYKMKNEFRHPDHHWEPDFDEIKKIISGIFHESNFHVKINPIGDGIDGIHISTLIVIDPKENL